MAVRLSGNLINFVIIITTQCFFPRIGGIESLMNGMANSFSKSGEKVIVLADGKKTENDKDFNFELVRFNQWKPIRKLLKARYISKLVTKNKVKAIYADSWKSIEHINKIFCQKLKVIVLAHGTEIPKENNFRYLKRIRVRKSYQKAKIILANSQYTKDLMIASIDIDHKKIFIVHPGIDVYYDKISIKDKINAHRIVKNSFPILITLARIEKRKGHEYVIKAIAKIKKDFPKVLYLIAGKGPYLKNIQELVKELKLENNVKFLGWVTEPEKSVLLEKSDIFIMTPVVVKESVEGFGMAFLDASFHKVAVIGSRSGGVIDAIKDNYTGLLCEPENIDAITKKISILANNSEIRNQLGKQGHELAVKSYIWEKKSLEYLSFL